jgi:hypothetical protein
VIVDSKQQRILARQEQQRAANVLNVACVIHGSLYPWEYVEKLYNMVHRHLSCEIRFHVFTEHDRPVPGTMIKHILTDWPGIAGRKRAWWYKMQMFDSRHIQGRMLYFDLDTVIVRNIDWITGLEPRYFWTIRDFRHLWRPAWKGINSSVMLWDTVRYDWIWQDFQGKNIHATTRLFHGDQDYLSSVLTEKDTRFIDPSLVKSWRWQIKDGGMDMKTRMYRRPDAGTVLDPQTNILIFHGNPKPHEILDQQILQYWQ